MVLTGIDTDIKENNTSADIMMENVEKRTIKLIGDARNSDTELETCVACLPTMSFRYIVESTRSMSLRAPVAHLKSGSSTITVTEF